MLIPLAFLLFSLPFARPPGLWRRTSQVVVGKSHPNGGFISDFGLEPCPKPGDEGREAAAWVSLGMPVILDALAGSCCTTPGRFLVDHGPILASTAAAADQQYQLVAECVSIVSNPWGNEEEVDDMPPLSHSLDLESMVSPAHNRSHQPLGLLVFQTCSGGVLCCCCSDWQIGAACRNQTLTCDDLAEVEAAVLLLRAKCLSFFCPHTHHHHHLPVLARNENGCPHRLKRLRHWGRGAVGVGWRGHRGLLPLRPSPLTVNRWKGAAAAAAAPALALARWARAGFSRSATSAAASPGALSLCPGPQSPGETAALAAAALAASGGGWRRASTRP